MILGLDCMQQKHPKVAYPSATRQVHNNRLFGDSKNKRSGGNYKINYLTCGKCSFSVRVSSSF